MVISYWSIILSFLNEPGEQSASPLALAFGLATIPFVYVTLAFGSKHPQAAMAVFQGVGLAMGFGLGLTVLAGDVITGLTGGFGAGVVAALRLGDGHNRKVRAAVAAVVTVYVFIVLRIAPEVAVVTGSLLPIPAVGLIDRMMERRYEAAQLSKEE